MSINWNRLRQNSADLSLNLADMSFNSADVSLHSADMSFRSADMNLDFTGLGSVANGTGRSWAKGWAAGGRPSGTVPDEWRPGIDNLMG
jgi:hypothetical protein